MINVTTGQTVTFLFPSSPLPPEELTNVIYEASGQDISIAVLTQVYYTTTLYKYTTVLKNCPSILLIYFI